MNCREAERAMILSFYGDIDGDAGQALEAHLQDCPACARKSAEMKTELGEMARFSGRRPEFDWDKCWRAIGAGVAKQGRARARKNFLVGRLLPAAAGAGILFLGILIGRHAFFGPARDLSPRPVDAAIMAHLIHQHLGETEIALLEVANRDAVEGGLPVMTFEKEITRSLSFRNRTMQTMARASDDPFLELLLNDLEVILYEAANLDLVSPEAVARLKALIRDKDIFFRIRHLKLPPDPRPVRKEAL